MIIQSTVFKWSLEEGLQPAPALITESELCIWPDKCPNH